MTNRVASPFPGLLPPVLVPASVARPARTRRAASSRGRCEGAPHCTSPGALPAAPAPPGLRRRLRDPVGFGGQYGYYTDRGMGLMCLTHRYYDPGTGKFLNRDPIGYEGGANLYGFADGNPVNEIDPDGTASTGTYWGDVGQVFAGYGDVLNPVKAYQSGKALYNIARTKGAGAAGHVFVQGTVQAYTVWTTTSDPRAFGQSFGTVLVTAASVAAPFAKGIGLPRGVVLTKLKYSPKALSQFERGLPGRIGPNGSPSGDFHGFPRIVDNYGRMARVTKIRGGDGTLRTRVRIPGQYKNSNGYFEYLIEPDGRTCNHRVFVRE